MGYTGSKGSMGGNPNPNFNHHEKKVLGPFFTEAHNPARNRYQQVKGRKGRKGRKGSKGSNRSKGSKRGTGRMGSNGKKGEQGEKGKRGNRR